MSNEITAKLECRIKEICNILESKNFKVTRRFILDATYFIPNTLILENMNIREILSKAILRRDISEFILNKENISKLNFKDKQIDRNGTILHQNKTDCKIESANAGKLFLKSRRKCLSVFSHWPWRWSWLCPVRRLLLRSKFLRKILILP